jgi:hypothetical protein
MNSRRRRTAKKLVLPAVALAMMISINYYAARDRARQPTFARPSAAARFAPDLHHR